MSLPHGKPCSIDTRCVPPADLGYAFVQLPVRAPPVARNRGRCVNSQNRRVRARHERTDRAHRSLQCRRDPGGRCGSGSWPQGVTEDHADSISPPATTPAVDSAQRRDRRTTPTPGYASARREPLPATIWCFDEVAVAVDREEQRLRAEPGRDFRLDAPVAIRLLQRDHPIGTQCVRHRIGVRRIRSRRSRAGVAAGDTGGNCTADQRPAPGGAR